MMKKWLAYFLAIFLLSKLVLLSGCANIIPPSGGPRDSLPPVLVNVNPPDSMKRFNSNRIVFNFNEFVELNNIQDNLIVSPLPAIPPIVESHLRTVTVRLKDTLHPNTTYSLNFGNAIRDINEGNVLKNFTYVFSTGNHFDSLGFSGRVLLAETGKPDSTLIVVLHTNPDDSAVAKDRPLYFTRLDSSGHFHFSNLPAATFSIYALKDESGLKRYTSRKQLFAFADQPVHVTSNTPPVNLFAYSEPDTARPTPSTTKTTAKTPAQDKALRVQTNLETGQLDLLSNLEMQFTTGLKTFDTAKLRLTNEVYEVLKEVKYILDSGRRKLSVQHAWLPARTYNLLVAKDFAEDSVGRKLMRNDTISFRTKNTTDYGSLKLRFINLDLSRHPVLQFVQNEQVKQTFVFKNRNVDIKLFPPGDYELRILYDENQNGRWDPGSFFGKHKQPETVQPLSRKLTVKPNWDTEVDISM